MDTLLRRATSGAAVAIVGTAYSLVFGGGTIPQCLGPLGVTMVRCVAHGSSPADRSLVAAEVLVLCCALGAIMALPARRTWIDGAAALLGLVAGPLVYALTRITSLEGPDYDGTWLVVPLPFDHWAIGLWAAAGCLLALAIRRVVVPLGHASPGEWRRSSVDRPDVTPGLSPS